MAGKAPVAETELPAEILIVALSLMWVTQMAATSLARSAALFVTVKTAPGDLFKTTAEFVGGATVVEVVPSPIVITIPVLPPCVETLSRFVPPTHVNPHLPFEQTSP